MAYQIDIVGREGYMENGEHVTTKATARCTDEAGHTVWASGISEEEAKTNAERLMDELLADEQTYQEAIAAEPDPDKQRVALMAVQIDMLRREIRRLGGKA